MWIVDVATGKQLKGTVALDHIGLREILLDSGQALMNIVHKQNLTSPQFLIYSNLCSPSGVARNDHGVVCNSWIPHAKYYTNTNKCTF
jgi:hypothetical protein